MSALPTWLLYRLAKPFFPKSHPWYGKNFSLKEWRQRQTELCIAFDSVFWVCAVSIVILAAAILSTL